MPSKTKNMSHKIIRKVVDTHPGVGTNELRRYNVTCLVGRLVHIDEHLPELGTQRCSVHDYRGLHKLILSTTLT